MNHAESEQVAADVVRLDREWEDAIIAKDVAAMDRLACDELVYTHAGGAVDDKPTFLRHITDGALTFVTIDHDDIAVRVHGSTAVLTCALHLTTIDRAAQPGELHFRTTHVWSEKDGRWRLLANQSTHIPQLPVEGNEDVDN